MGVGGGEREEKRERERDMIPLQSIKNIEFSNHTPTKQNKKTTQKASPFILLVYIYSKLFSNFFPSLSIMKKRRKQKPEIEIETKCYPHGNAQPILRSSASFFFLSCLSTAITTTTSFFLCTSRISWLSKGWGCFLCLSFPAGVLLTRPLS